jgi:SSS family transporter
MDATFALLLIVGYFALLMLISYLTGRGATEQTFFTANRNSPWYVVAFGMIGASLSGVTFISVPGAVGNGQWAYLQMVLGYLVGYAVIAFILMPLYYRLRLTSIYGYLGQRFGPRAYLSGSVLFLVSRVIGASLRLYLVALVLQLAVSDAFGLPFPLTVLISIGLIYLYTFRGGIKTVVWTDTLQTAAMLVGAGITVWVIAQSFGWSVGDLVAVVEESSYSRTFFWDWAPGNNFFKQFLSGAGIATVMTGLDQDMMQKNLTIRNLGEAQRNVLLFSVILMAANLLFLTLGALLYLYGQGQGLIDPVFVEGCAIRLADGSCIATDELFPYLALHHLGPVAAVVFVLGVIAAAYSSADSALTALTTAFCVDILKFEQRDDEAQKRRLRYLVHVGFAGLLLAVILVFQAMNDRAVIWAVFKAAGYTYGPLLGLYAFGLYAKRQARDRAIPWICLLAPVLSYLIDGLSPRWLGYEFGFEILILNGFLTFVGLWAVSEQAR